ncbi:MAG: helicase [bacterium]|nr:helicase [bacterium]
MDYREFLAGKAISTPDAGLDLVPDLNPMLFDFQRDIGRWALRRGRAAIFADCGLGKTPMQLEWAKHVPGDVLILAPLAVAPQTVREGEKFGAPVRYVRDGADVDPGISIANYEMLHHFDVSRFAGIVLDESSILKAYTGKFRNQIIESFASTPYRLACTATPAPNDFMELGNHAEFLGAMSRTEMLSMFFVHDGGETQKWRIKRHAQKEYWRWICSWAVMIRKPSDLGYDDGDFTLPPLRMHEHVVPVDECDSEDGMLFRLPASTLRERQTERRLTVDRRADVAAEMANASDEPWLIWCDRNDESRALAERIPDAVEITGSDKLDRKESAMLDFSAGKIRVLVTKPSIAGFGMNWQHCRNVAFVGLSDSYEQFYQAVRRCWRFGQTQEVHCHIITAATEGAVVANIKRKERDAQHMASSMVGNMHDYNEQNIRGTESMTATYEPETEQGDGWTAHMGDCVDICHAMDDNSIDYTVFSPPFASLYTYSNSDRDMGNCKDDGEFMTHFGFLIGDLLRITKPGRLCSFHCMNLPTVKCRQGYIGLRDFRGDLIRLFEAAGWIYHSEACIWKDPVTAMQRTKALGLLHKQLKKDSCMSRQGIPDYFVTMRKPGTNPNPVAGELSEWVGDDTFKNTGNLSIDIWQRYASPIWTDINPSRTLQHRSAREHNDERHICPLQLDVIERGVQLWSNPGDLVLSPFMGIGSEGHVALSRGRRFVGVELKESYYRQAVKNLAIAVRDAQQDTLLCQ